MDVFNYDGVYRLTDVKYSVPNSDIGDWNNASNIPFDQLAGQRTVEYNMDGVGNRTSVVDDGKVTTYATNSVNEYVYVDNQRLSYDQNGNMTSDGNLRMFYDHNNMLVEIRTPEYIFHGRFDAIGRRLMVQFSDGLTETCYFWYDGQQVICEEVSGLTEPYRYVWGNGIDEALLRFGNGDIWYLDNQLGSVMALTDSSGQIVERYSYDVYGAVTAYDSSGQQISVTNYDNRYLFTGREYNWQTKLYHYRARTYHPYLGRFTSHDFGMLCSYEYVGSSPTSYVDPLGLFICAKGTGVKDGKKVVDEFVNLLNRCGASVKIEGCCGRKGYLKIVWNGAPPNKTNVFGWFVHTMATGKQEAYFDLIKGNSGGNAFVGYFGAMAQQIWMGDFRALQAILPLESGQNDERPSVCELLLHELAERWCAVVPQPVGERKGAIVPFEEWWKGGEFRQERWKYWYGYCHEFAMDVQSLYRLSKGVAFWIVLGILPPQRAGGASIVYASPFRMITVTVKYTISRGRTWQLVGPVWRIPPPPKKREELPRPPRRIQERIEWVLRKWRQLTR